MKPEKKKNISPPAAPKTAASPSGDLLSRVDAFLYKRRKTLLYAALALGTLFSLLLFDGRMSFATDDATYLANAVAFLQRGSYPTFQGALYPIVLALLIKVVGFKILALKFFSIIFLVLQIWVYFRAFEGRVPYFILFCGLFVIPFNAYILAYASSTFTESFFMLVQALAFLSFFRLLDRLQFHDTSLRSTWKYWLVFGLCFFLLSITKNVTALSIGIVMVFFFIRKEWKYAFIALAAFLLFRIPYEVGARAAFGNISSNQTELLLRKDFNDPSKGTVDAADLADRFFENFGNYISIHTFKMLGLRNSGVPSLYTNEKIKEYREPMEFSWGYTLVFLALFCLAIYQSFRQNRFLFFTALYVAGICFLVFVGIHTFWNQDRYMVVFLPFFLSIFLYGMYALGKTKWKWMQPVTVIFGALCLLLQLGQTFKSSSKNMKYAKNYARGNMYAGLSPLHTNYAKMAEWVGINVPADTSVLASKPEEAFAYGKKLQYTRVPSNATNADSLFAFMKRTNTQYMLVSQGDETAYRMNPMFYKTLICWQAVMQKYPTRLEMVHQEGADVEPAVLYRVK